MNLRSEEELFYQASQIEDQVARAEFLDQACGADAALRESLDQLLACSEDEADDLLESSPVRRATIDVSGPARAQGSTPGIPQQESVSRYTILNRLGEGGFGIVYRALQESPLKREVALKILKAEMGSADVVRRFESERQLLASMNHPNIAAVLDAGTTDDGRPFFAMELVRGQPIDEFCNTHRLGIPDRLQLVLDICDAVQYAHQKSIVHRDLKPSNVLVSIVGNAAQQNEQLRRTPSIRDSNISKDMNAKVIDFGIAKVLDAAGTSLTATNEQHLLGTPEYMSPEQVTPGRDIDTRADVFAIGGILYKLLTGVSPLSGRGGASRTLAEGAKSTEFDVIDAYRSILERQPARPSEFLRVAPKKPHSEYTDPRRVEGDLDWIVLKALSPDPNERYQTAHDLAADIRRHSKRQPISAGPATAWYRWKKFALRNRIAVVATLLVTTAIAAGALLAAVGFWHARYERGVAVREKHRAEVERDRAEQVSQALQRLVGTVHTDAGHAKDYTVWELLTEFAESVDQSFDGQPIVEAQIRQILGKSYLSIGDPSRAAVHLTRALELRLHELGEQHVSTVGSRIDMAHYSLYMSNLGDAQRHLDAALANLRDTDSGIESVRADELLSRIHSEFGRHTEALHVLTRSRDTAKHRLGDEHPLTARLHVRLAQVTLQQGKLAEADQLSLVALAMMQKIRPDRHVDTAMAKRVRAMTLRKLNKHYDAEVLCREAIATNRRLLGEDDGRRIHDLIELSFILRQTDRWTEAETLARQVVELADRSEVRRAILQARSRVHLAAFLERRRPAEAAEVWQQAIDVKQKLLGSHPEVALLHLRLGHVQRTLGEVTLAAGEYRKAYRIVQGADEQQLRESTRARRAEETTELAFFRVAINLLEVLDELGQSDESEDIAREYRRRAQGSDSTQVKGLLDILLARQALMANDLEQADVMTESAINRLRELEQNSQIRPRAYLLRARYLIARREFAKAEALLRTSNPVVQRRRQAYSVFQREWAMVMIHLYDEWGRPRQASRWRNRLTRKEQSPKS